VILVDSDVLIEHLRGMTAARDWLLGARQSSWPLAISVVSLTEVARGMRSPERREVMRLLGSMQRFDVTKQVAWRAATLIQEYRRSHSGIGLGDYLIAATALTERTRNRNVERPPLPHVSRTRTPFLISPGRVPVLENLRIPPGVARQHPDTEQVSL
jgi:predicted nucleic acid-binding protein